MMVMSIAGIDPSGGAGLFRDIKTFQSLKVYGTGIPTALTSQNPYKMFSMKKIPKEFIEEEIDSVFDSYNQIEFIKTGMLYSEDIIKLVSKKIKEYNLKAVVDPVMIATSGGLLSKRDISKAFLKYLLPKAILVTPNISEASKLSQIKIKNVDDSIKASKKIGKTCNTIITGGHLDGINIIYLDGKIIEIKEKLIKTDNLHGSGCTLSAAITSYLALGSGIEIAIRKALEYTNNAVKNGKYGTLIH